MSRGLLCLWVPWVLALVVPFGARAQTLPPTTLYLHSDGLDLKISPQSSHRCIPGISKDCGVSNARTNTSWLPDLQQDRVQVPAMRFETYGPSRRLVRAALLAQVRQLFLGINLKIVDQRPPPTERYSMVVIGGRAQDLGLSGAIAGLAPLDCEDANPWDITFVFSEAMSDLEAVARVVAQEAAHSYGIEHVSAPDFVMNPEPVGGLYGFSRSCVPMDPSPGLSNPDGIKCIHDCEDPSYQNAFAELRRMFGASPLPRNSTPPQVLFSSLGSGEHFFETPATVQLDLQFVNPSDLTGMEIRVNQSEPVYNNMYPYAYQLSGLQTGLYEVQVQSHDIHGNVGQASIEFSVGPAGQGSKSSMTRPIPGPGQIQPKVMRLTGEPVRCVSDKVCYGGTTCQDGLCLRRPQSASGCRLAGAKTSPFGAWLTWLLGALYARARRRPKAFASLPCSQTAPVAKLRAKL